MLRTIFVFTKLHSLNNSINESLDRDHSQLRQKAKEGDPMTVVLYGIDDDRKTRKSRQRSDSIVLMSINPKDKNCNGKCTS